MEDGDVILDDKKKDKKYKKAKTATSMIDQYDKTEWNDEEKKHLIDAYAQELAGLKHNT